jgi:hypothetical protein
LTSKQIGRVLWVGRDLHPSHTAKKKAVAFKAPEDREEKGIFAGEEQKAGKVGIRNILSDLLTWARRRGRGFDRVTPPGRHKSRLIPVA